MLKNRDLRAKASTSLGALIVGMSLFGVTAHAQFRPNRLGTNGVIVYDNPNFRGASVALRGDTPDLRAYGLNDKVTSIEIPRGEAWEVCQDVNFQNRCETLTSSVADLRAIGWNDRISSMRRVDGGFRNSDGVFSSRQRSQGLVFYDRPGFRGTTTVVTTDAYSQGAIGNRRVRSVEVRGGTWQLCDRTGRCSTINQSVSDLSQLGLNGQITSVRPVNNTQGYGGYGQRRWDPRARY